MIDLRTTFMGMPLKNPLIVGSSGYTESLENLKIIEELGAGAVVLKSLFEEEILHEMKENFTQMTSQGFIYPETYNFFEYDEMEDTLDKYIYLITEAKKHLSIPVIASVNCVSSQKWATFVQDLESAGADAIEINAFILPSDINGSSAEMEERYFKIVEEVRKNTKLPFSLKISYYFTALSATLHKLSQSGINGLTLFNRFYSPDINLKTMEVVPSFVLSSPTDLAMSLRWISMMYGRVFCDLSASTGVHSGDDFIKLLLAGADTVQVASVLYKKGLPVIATILSELQKWMQENNFKTIDDFKGKMSYSTVDNPAAFERIQFMKNFSGK